MALQPIKGDKARRYIDTATGTTFSYRKGKALLGKPLPKAKPVANPRRKKAEYGYTKVSFKSQDAMDAWIVAHPNYVDNAQAYVVARGKFHPVYASGQKKQETQGERNIRGKIDASSIPLMHENIQENLKRAFLRPDHIDLFYKEYGA